MATRASARSTPLLNHRQRLTTLLVLFGATVLSTAAHYTHNYIEIAHYPQASYITNHSVRLGIVILWPLLTGVGAFGAWLYARGRYAAALPLLALYSVLGLITFGHFTVGQPHIPPFWYATIFTDGIFALALLAFAYWSAVTPAADAPTRDS